MPRVVLQVSEQLVLGADCGRHSDRRKRGRESAVKGRVGTVL